MSALPEISNEAAVTAPSTSNAVLFINSNFVDNNLANIVCVPAFCSANSITPSSFPSVTSPALPVILESTVVAPPSSSSQKLICTRYYASASEALFL